MAKKRDTAATAPSVEGTPAAGEAVDAATTGLVKRVKTSAIELKEKAEDYKTELEGRRSTNRIIDAVFGSVEHETSVGGPILAGAVAFRFFLFVVPYVFVLIFGFGLGSNAAGQDPGELARKSGIVGLAATAITASSDASTFAQIVTFFVALYALLSASRTLVKALNIVHALIWRLPVVRPRGLMKKALAAIGLLTLMLVVEAVINKVHTESVLIWIIATALLILVPTGMWLFVTLRVFPSAADATWRDLWPGAVLFGVGVELLHLGTVVWISRSFNSKSETYGALGAALTILFWAYILGRLVTAATSLNAVLWEKNHPVDPSAPSAAWASPAAAYEAATAPPAPAPVPSLQPAASPFDPPQGPPATSSQR